jgi:hypothetical protein
MTIALSANTPRVSYTVNQGATHTAFTVNFEFFDDADLNFYVDGTKKTLSTHYTVSGGNGSTGTINTTSNNSVVGLKTVVITRDIALARITDFPSSGSFQVATLNTELDRFTAIVSDISDETTRSIQLADEDSAVSMELPLLASRKGTVLGFNASTGAVEAGPTIANVNSLSAITANINTVAGIASNTTTVAGISANVTTVAGISGNVTTLAGISGNITTVEGKASLITADFASDMALIDSAFVGKMDLVTSDFVTDMAVVTSDFIADLNSLATTAIIADLDLLATSDFVSDLNAVEGIKANVTTVAGNVAGVNSFASRYRVASSDPSSDNDAGDLVYNTNSNVLKYYNGSAFETVSAITTGISSGNVAVFTSGVADDDFLRVSGTSIEGRSASEVASDIGAATVDEATALAIAL